MTKGRQFIQSSTSDGTWFPHNVEQRRQEENSSNATWTSEMLQPQVAAGSRPKHLPFLFSHREQPCYRTSNPFSAHDNRHTIQGHAEYLGDGSNTRLLGRRLHPIYCRLHYTDVNFLHHNSSDSRHQYSPTTSATYTDPRLLEPLTNRRFPKIYNNKQSTQATMGAVNGQELSYRTPLHVLAITQKPFSTHNDWKYSFRGDGTVYPPYHTKKYTSSLPQTGSSHSSSTW